MWKRINPEIYHPESIFLRVGGEKNLREKYLYGLGLATSADGKRPLFVGTFDSYENIELFKKRVREDSIAQNRLRRELGDSQAASLTGRKVLIVDDTEFEGVSRLFLENIIAEAFEPSHLEYLEFGDMQDVPTGLSGNNVRSFISRPSRNKRTIKRSQRARHELEMIVEEFCPGIV